MVDGLADNDGAGEVVGSLDTVGLELGKSVVVGRADDVGADENVG